MLKCPFFLVLMSAVLTYCNPSIHKAAARSIFLANCLTTSPFLGAPFLGQLHFPFFISRYKILPLPLKILINWFYPPAASCSAPRHELLLANQPCSEPLPPSTCLIFSSIYVLFQPPAAGSSSLVTSSNFIILQNADINSSVTIPTKKLDHNC